MGKCGGQFGNARNAGKCVGRLSDSLFFGLAAGLLSQRKLSPNFIACPRNSRALTLDALRDISAEISSYIVIPHKESGAQAGKRFPLYWTIRLKDLYPFTNLSGDSDMRIDSFCPFVLRIDSDSAVQMNNHLARW